MVLGGRCCELGGRLAMIDIDFFHLGSVMV